ncbi:hypothetical protein TorRG33x02_177580 [Trema orientale]|uniref:Uncharacterized protein n=1 Tax=Trema orientale TaxID=63057 RepID=A0A2P5ELG9_TREOI|nr:hypothetical protein TorRG33x02_177580 [Trema orientale]
MTFMVGIPVVTKTRILENIVFSEYYELVVTTKVSYLFIEISPPGLGPRL